jgi:hypothetical protein
MESKVSKAQEEVWEWKDSLFEELKRSKTRSRIFRNWRWVELPWEPA